MIVTSPNNESQRQYQENKALTYGEGIKNIENKFHLELYNLS